MEGDYEVNMEAVEEQIFDIVANLMKEYPDKEESCSYIFSIVRDAVDNVEEGTFIPTHSTVKGWIEQNVVE